MTSGRTTDELDLVRIASPFTAVDEQKISITAFACIFFLLDLSRQVSDVSA
jgi:hypothetical protein